MPTATTTDVEFLAEARERYEAGMQADAEDRAQAEADNKFAYADDKNLGQWDEAAVKARTGKRPILQWNRIPTSVQQVANDGRENKPSIKITPGDGGVPETAEFLQGRIRQIEYDSDADTAKDTARDQQITTGRGFIRVRTEYIPGTFRQKICIDRIENQFSVVWDPAAHKYDRSDADWCFVVSHISRDQHMRDYGKESVVNRMDFADARELAPKWIGIGSKSELIQIAEYWVKKYKNRTLCLLTSQELPAWKDQLTAGQYDTFKRNGNIVQERQEKCPTVMQYVINGAEILSETEWLGSTIPIVPVWGKEAVVEGQRRTFSLIRNAKDPQKMLNLLVSNLAEKLAQMARTPIMVPVGGIAEQHSADWVNDSAAAYRLYVQWDNQGRQLNKPERIDYEPPIQGLLEGIRGCIDAIKASMGIYDAALGAKSNETSGIAIQRRQKESDVSNYHFPDNEARSNKYLGKILVELIPKVDKAGSNAEIRTEDGKTHVVPVGTPHKDWKTGEVVCHDLSQGQYGVSVSTGPSATSQRQEQYERDATLIQAAPELMWVFGDQMFASDDTPGHEDRADRMKRAIEMKTPGLIQEKGDQPQIPQQVQQQMMAMQKELGDTKAFAQSLHEQIQSKQPELQNQFNLKQMELQAKQAEAAADIELRKYVCDEQEKTKRTIGLATIDQTDAITAFKAELEVLKVKFQQIHDRSMLEKEHTHAADTQQKDQTHQAELSAADRQAAADQQQEAQAHAESQSEAERAHSAEQADADRKAAAKTAAKPAKKE